MAALTAKPAATSRASPPSMRRWQADSVVVPGGKAVAKIDAAQDGRIGTSMALAHEERVFAVVWL